MTNKSRIIQLITAALSRSDATPDDDMFQWLTDGWNVIQWRIQTHLDAGRIKQAKAWSDASYFFAERYAGRFIAY
jgi:hypothetical protein